MDNAKRAQQRLIAKGYVLVDDGDFGARSITALMAYVGGGGAVTQLQTLLGAGAAKHFGAVGLMDPLCMAHALGQQSAETGGFKTMVESLNYSATGLRATFSKARISDADVNRLGRKPGGKPLSEAVQAEIANLVYGGKWGADNLGNNQPGDGWRFRGRGAKQTTGRANYGDVKAVTGIDVLSDPAQLQDPDLGMRAATIFWDKKGCNAFAKADDIDGLTKRINGGLNGIDTRRAALARAKTILL